MKQYIALALIGLALAMLGAAFIPGIVKHAVDNINAMLIHGGK